MREVEFAEPEEAVERQTEALGEALGKAFSLVGCTAWYSTSRGARRTYRIGQDRTRTAATRTRPRPDSRTNVERAHALPRTAVDRQVATGHRAAPVWDDD